MLILGLNAYHGDSSACILKDGKLIAAAEEERFTRKKHDFEFPYNAIRFCLAQGNVNGKNLDYVVFFEKPFLKFERLMRTAISGFPRTYPMFARSMRTWLVDKLWVKMKPPYFSRVKVQHIKFYQRLLWQPSKDSSSSVLYCFQITGRLYYCYAHK